MFNRLLLVLFATFALTTASGQTIAVCPSDNGKALVNPDMGWTMHFYSNVPSNYGSQLEPEDVLEDFPGLSTVYLRLPWAFIEPEENHFNWEWLDTPAHPDCPRKQPP